MERRPPVRQAERFRPVEIDENPQKTSARYGTVEAEYLPDPPVSHSDELPLETPGRRIPGSHDSRMGRNFSGVPSRDGDSYLGQPYGADHSSVDAVSPDTHEKPVQFRRTGIPGSRRFSMARTTYGQSTPSGYSSYSRQTYGIIHSPDSVPPGYGGTELSSREVSGNAAPYSARNEVSVFDDEVDHDEMDLDVYDDPDYFDDAGVPIDVQRDTPTGRSLFVRSGVRQYGGLREESRVNGSKARSRGTSKTGGRQSRRYDSQPHSHETDGEDGLSVDEIEGEHSERPGERHTFRNAAMIAELAEMTLETGDGEAQPLYQRIRRIKRRTWAAKRSVRLAKSGARTAGRMLRRIAQTVRRFARNLLDKVVVKTVLANIALPVLAAVLLAVIIAAIFLSMFSLKSTESDLSQVYLYITQMDAEMEQRIRNAGQAGMETTWYVNGYESSQSSGIHIQTSADYLLLYLDIKYLEYNLSTPISGAFGGQTIQAELSAIHDRLYSCRTSIVTEELTVPSEDESEEPETITIQRCEVYVTMKSVAALLDEAGVLDDEELERLQSMSSIGTYTALEALSSPFESYYYVKDRWGWYVTSDRALAQRTGVELMPLSSGTVYSTSSGTVESVGSGSVRVSVGENSSIYYSNLSSVTVSVGQELTRGEAIGAATAARGVYLEYIRDDEYVNPVFFLPGSSATGDASDLISIAAAQIGNVGGQTYWSWFGFGSRVNWCACFVSWCAEQCGYIDAGLIPKYSYCPTGASWFKARGLWQEPGYIPSPGDIIFFDFNHEGETHHTGIVESCDGTTIVTIEGNTSNSVRRRTYSVYSTYIYGFGTPAY